MTYEDANGYIRPGPEHAELPGRPRGKLVRDVRSVLWRYLRARPQRLDRSWRLAWQWAAACAHHNRPMIGKHTVRWPSGNEIASQYLLLVLAEMRQMHALRLPFRAGECVPVPVLEQLGGPSPLPMLALEGRAEQ